MSRLREFVDTYHDLESETPPAPSKNREYATVHDELVVLQMVARSTIEAHFKDRKLSWHRFVSDNASHRDLGNDRAELTRFLERKLGLGDAAPKRGK